MGAKTRTHVVITHINKAKSLAGIVWQTAEVNPIGYLIARNVFGNHWQILADDLVHAGLNLAHLLIGQRLRQIIIALALFALNVVHSGTPAMEHIVHSAVKDVLCSMRRRVFILVMRIQNGLFHIANVLKILNTCVSSPAKVSRYFAKVSHNDVRCEHCGADACGTSTIFAKVSHDDPLSALCGADARGT